MDAGLVAAALESLPIEEREVVVLRIWSGRSFDEIAALIGKSTSTAHRRFEMGLNALRKAVSPASIEESSNERRT
jgi:RNA polymerase sigma-70 factor (ECF subfamily)